MRSYLEPENKPLTTVQGGTTTTFVYDGDGGRVKKIVGTTTTRYLSKLYECDNTNCSRFIWAGSTRIATIAVNTGAIQYWHGDHLGSSSVITDSTGAKVQTVTYYPFGGTRTNQSPSTPAIDVPYKYTGKELDSTGLYYYEARYYDPQLARFISADTIVPNPRDPQSLNRYSYVENNPLRYTDPTGHFKIKFNKFFNRAFGDVGTTLVGIAVGAFTGCPTCGMAIMTQSQSGRYVLAAGVVATSAVATFYCGGCGAAFTIAGTTMYAGGAAATVGAVGVGTLGAISAAHAGGDISSGLLLGTVLGAAAGYANATIGAAYGPGTFEWSGAFAGKAALAGLANMTGGAVLNGTSGLAIGYAGGKGNLNTMLQSAG